MRRSRVVVVVAVLAASAMLASACSGPSTGTEVRSHQPRDDPQPVTRSRTVLANSSFGASLYHALATREGNFVFSPLAVSEALAMARAGAAGATADQLDRVQDAPDGLDLEAGLNTVLQDLDGRLGDQQNDLRRGRISFDLPTSLWGQKDTRFGQPFLDTLARSFGTGVRVVDFRSGPEAARRAMNNWVADQTDDNISDIVPRGVITEATRLEATVAAYLQAPWDQRFDVALSRPAPFTRADNQTVTVTTMELKAPTGLLYGSGDGWQAVELPYLGRQLAMVVVMPDAGRMADVESHFDGAMLQQVLAGLTPTALDLHLPRFAFTTQGELDDPLSEIGVPDAFSSSAADFSGITGDEALWIAGFSHQAFVSADEEGTEGAAVTVVPNTPAPITAKLTPVSIDRSFLVMVVDRDTDEPLLLGRVMDPTP